MAMGAMTLRNIAVWAMAGALTGCATLEPVHDLWHDGAPNPEAYREQLHIGDKVEVTTRNGGLQRLKISNLDDTALTGTGERAGATVVQIPYEQILRIDMRGHDYEKPARVAGKLAGGTIVVVGVIALIVGVTALCTSDRPCDIDFR
jgi:hypothetical protein